MIRKKVYVDMDQVLCNFIKAAIESIIETPEQKYPQSRWGFFLSLEEIEDSIYSFRRLQEKYDVWILTRPSFKNINCYSEKAQWVLDHLGIEELKKTIMCGDKSLVKGDYLIDDNGEHGQDVFEGEWIYFGSSKFPDWKSVIDYLM